MSCRERRADPEMRTSAQLSAELCSPDWRHFHTTLRCTESVHFLWPLNRKFSGLLVRPWMISSLPGFLDLWLNVCSPSQVLWDSYSKVLEAAHPLHRGPTDHKRSVGPLLSLPEVHNQLFSFAHIQRETVVLALMWVFLPHPNMRSHHCWKWGPKPQYHQQIWQ